MIRFRLLTTFLLTAAAAIVVAFCVVPIHRFHQDRRATQNLLNLMSIAHPFRRGPDWSVAISFIGIRTNRAAPASASSKARGEFCGIANAEIAPSQLVGSE